MSFVSVLNITVEYKKNTPILHDISIEIEKGEFISLLGPSGCGKTTFLRTIMGFLRPKRGRIYVDGRDCTFLPPYKRNFGIVFQSYALFPHMTVFDNVAYGLRMRRMPKDEIQKKVSEVLELVDLTGLEDRFPKQLSGGQAQRVALARAIVINPRLLLLDEPLSNLDAKLRESMRTELRRLHKELQITSIYVTHDQTEALALSDRIAIMNQGRIMQVGTPEEIFYYPQNVFVAEFVGFVNMFLGKIINVGDSFTQIEVNQSLIKVPIVQHEFKSGDRVVFAVRPTAITFSSEPTDIVAQIETRVFQGEKVLYVVKCPLGELLVHSATEPSNYHEGQKVYLKLLTNGIVMLRDTQ